MSELPNRDEEQPQYVPEAPIDVSAGIPEVKTDYKVKITSENIENEVKVAEKEIEAEYAKDFAIIEEVKNRNFANDEEYENFLSKFSDDEQERWLSSVEDQDSVSGFLFNEHAKCGLAKKIESTLNKIKKRRSDKIEELKDVRTHLVDASSQGGSVVETGNDEARLNEI